MASLVHDLGHLPFSHDFEMALDDHFRADEQAHQRGQALLKQGVGGDKIHERVGYALAGVVQQSVFNEVLAGTPFAKPAEVALMIARDILNAPAAPELAGDEHAPVVSWLHSLVAGEIDVDRADYVLRDVRHYALAAAVYDLDRLADNLAPVRSDDGRLETAVLARGVSAAEGFLVARFRMYAWAVYHHKIQQAAAGLRVASTDLLASGGDEIGVFLSDITAIAGGMPTPDAVTRFIDYDDSWWTGLLRRRLREGAPALVEPWLALFTRRTPGPVSMWKRASDFPWRIAPLGTPGCRTSLTCRWRTLGCGSARACARRACYLGAIESWCGKPGLRAVTARRRMTRQLADVSWSNDVATTTPRSRWRGQPSGRARSGGVAPLTVHAGPRPRSSGARVDALRPYRYPGFLCLG